MIDPVENPTAYIHHLEDRLADLERRLLRLYSVDGILTQIEGRQAEQERHMQAVARGTQMALESLAKHIESHP